MAASATPRSADSRRHRVVAVAYSAGRDSTALLHATAMAAAESGVHVVALHVHHGLSAYADEWLAHAEAQCLRWAKQGLPVSFVCRRLTDKPKAGDSIEAWARRARYRALREMALQADAAVVMLAHHRRDQAETLLLQALRGAGVAGLAGMPKAVERDGVTWLRPWLSHSRESIEAYVRSHRLRYVDDDSNDDARFARNRLRLNVWPSLSTAFPQVETSLAASAAWAGEAMDCLDELAALDLAEIECAGGLDIKAWERLSPPRRSNALRAWLKAQTAQAPAASLTARLQQELSGKGSATWELPGGTLKRHRGMLVYVDAVSAAPTQRRETELRIAKAGAYALPGWRGVVRAVKVGEGGVSLTELTVLELRLRGGGEQFQSGPGRPPRALKKQFQAADVPAWERDGPLIFSRTGQLVFVPGLGVDARMLALPGTPQLGLRWLPG